MNEFHIQANSHSIRFILEVESWIKSNVYSDFSVNYKFDWNPSRRSSRGGIYKDGPGINMAMYWAVPNNLGTTYRFYEYKSFDSDKYIGGFFSRNPYDKLEAILLHEVAHAVQFFSYKKTGTRCKPHGPVFKHFYKLLRQQFLNNKLPQQDPLRSDYESYVQLLVKKSA